MHPTEESLLVEDPPDPEMMVLTTALNRYEVFQRRYVWVSRCGGCAPRRERAHRPHHLIPLQHSIRKQSKGRQPKKGEVERSVTRRPQ